MGTANMRIHKTNAQNSGEKSQRCEWPVSAP
jgi:hypothetical protein